MSKVYRIRTQEEMENFGKQALEGDQAVWVEDPLVDTYEKSPFHWMRTYGVQMKYVVGADAEGSTVYTFTVKKRHTPIGEKLPPIPGVST